MIAELTLAGVAEVRFTGRAEGDLGRTSDEGVAVRAAREGLRGALGLDSIAGARQVHGEEVSILARPLPGYVLAANPADGQATGARGAGLAVHVADCLPVAIAGPGGVAILHAGWRGLAAGVIENGVAALRKLDCQGPLEAVIGPGAGGCCYEAGPEVREAFGDSHRGEGGRTDLKAIARARLLAAGVERVDDVGLCTLCAQAGLLFSHRRDGSQTGRQAGIVWLR